MGEEIAGRQQDQVFRPLVAFDFDGTLTFRDSFRAFLAWRAGPRRYVTGLIKLAPAAVSYLFHRDRGRLKTSGGREVLNGAARGTAGGGGPRFATQPGASPFAP